MDRKTKRFAQVRLHLDIVGRGRKFFSEAENLSSVFLSPGYGETSLLPQRGSNYPIQRTECLSARKKLLNRLGRSLGECPLAADRNPGQLI